MGKGKRNHKNKKSKPSKPAVATGSGNSEESVSPPTETPPPPSPSYPDSPMPATEDKPPVGSVGAGAPIENNLSETHPLPVEKGIPKVGGGRSETIEGGNTDDNPNINERTPTKSEHAQTHDASVEDRKTDSASAIVEAEPTPRMAGGSGANHSAVEQENQVQPKEEKEELEQTEENREASTNTPNPTASEIPPSAHKKRRSRSGTSEETQEAKHNRLNSEDIGPQHAQADRETRELQHIDLEGGEIGYSLGKGDDHDRGSEHSAPMEPTAQDSTNNVRTSREDPSNEALAEQVVTCAQVAAEEPLTENLTQNAGNEPKEEKEEEGEEGTVTYAQVAASKSPDIELAEEQVASDEAQSSPEGSWTKIAAQEVAPETQELRDEMKDDMDPREAIVEGAATGEPSRTSEKPIDGSKGICQESVSVAGGEGVTQVQSSGPSETTAEETAPETDELKDIDVKDDIRYNLRRGGDHDRGSQHHTPAKATAPEDPPGAKNSAQGSEDVPEVTEEIPSKKVSSKTKELRVIDMKDGIGYNAGKGDGHDRSSEHRAPMEEPVVKYSESRARSTVEDVPGEVPPDTAPETQALKEIDLRGEFGYNPGKGDTHGHWSEHNAPVADLSVGATEHKTPETRGSSTNDKAAEDMEEAFEELLMEDSARGQEISEEASSAENRPASVPAGGELAFGASTGVNDPDEANKHIELMREQKIDSAARHAAVPMGQSDSSILNDLPVEETKRNNAENGLPHEDITNDDIPNNTYTEDASDSTKKKSEESAEATSFPKSTQPGGDAPGRREIERNDSLEHFAPHSPLGIDSLASELGKSYHIPMSNDPSSRGDTNDTPLTYQEEFFSERLSDLTGNREVLEYECRIKMGDSNLEPSLINGTSVTLDQLQETISCFKREVLESLESRNLLVDIEDTQQDQGQQKLTVDISQLGPRLGKMESDLDFIRKQISSINTSHSNGPSLLPQYSSRGDRASRSNSPSPPVPERRFSWSMISLSVVTALGLVALGSMLGSVTRERGLTDKVAQWLFSEGKVVVK